MIAGFVVWRRVRVEVLPIQTFTLVGWHALALVVADHPPAWLVVGLVLLIAALVESVLVCAFREDPPQDPEGMP